ncbi:hypothetical protein L2E82_45003 [Cichorium intybus]|uniref:Uncharacterized protein n=1 Tax=Cichorium intybus TaxID=13427 RepID=A0ACB8ZS49_CICIN|nr:hypothetical protein L2E82_45003 [Cichorium intybus]
MATKTTILILSISTVMMYAVSLGTATAPEFLLDENIFGSEFTEALHSLDFKLIYDTVKSGKPGTPFWLRSNSTQENYVMRSNNKVELQVPQVDLFMEGVNFV